MFDHITHHFSNRVGQGFKYCTAITAAEHFCHVLTFAFKLIADFNTFPHGALNQLFATK